MTRASFPAALALSMAAGLFFTAADTLEGQIPQPVLVADVNTSPGSSSAGPFGVLNGVAYFRAFDLVHGSELWRSDGTAEGTHLLKEFVPGTGGTNVSNFTRVGQTLFFIASTSANGLELWKTDGTAGGTVIVKDIWPGPTSGFPQLLTVVGNVLFFQANDGVTGVELWKSDGTAAGTQLVRDIFPGSNGSNPNSLVNLNGLLLFSAAHQFGSDGPTIGERELWRSDGTTAGTVQVLNINGGFSSEPSGMAVSGGRVFYSAFVGGFFGSGFELWATNGTASGTFLVRDIRPGFSGGFPLGSFPGAFADVGGVLFFSADDGVNGRELWKSNGTFAGTVLVEDINPGSPSSFPGIPTVIGGIAYFNATTVSSGSELWRSDGTAAGTDLVLDIAPGSTGSNPFPLTAVGSSLVFPAFSPASGTELWRSDGTAATTALVRDIAPGTQSASPSQMAVLDTRVIFRAFDPDHGDELWITDGTTAGTTVTADINVGTQSSEPLGFVADGQGHTYFLASDGIAGRELWRTDGTPAGTHLVRDVNPGPSTGIANPLVALGGIMYFAGITPLEGTELWRSDGTPAGTQLVKDIVPGSGSAGPQSLTLVNGRLYFTACDTAGCELWVSDGTSGGTFMFKEFIPGASSGHPGNLTVVGGALYFSAQDLDAGRELWKTDGTAVGTVRVKDINPGTSSSNPSRVVDAGGVLYFTAFTSATGAELWRTDGTDAGTQLVMDIHPGANSANIGPLTRVADLLMFAANDGVHGDELWRSDGTPAGTALVHDIQPGTGSSSPFALAALDGRVLFRAFDSSAGDELWSSAGTSAGTQRVKDIAPGPLGSNVSGTTRLNSLVYFQACAAQNDCELWQSDGTEDGTVLVKDIREGTGGSFPRNFAVADATLYFSADNGAFGFEPWMLTPPAQNAAPSADAGPDITIEAVAPLTPAALDASGSTDPDAGDVLSFKWTDAADTVVATTAQATLDLAVGPHVFTVTVTDSFGVESTDTVTVRVDDTTPPSIAIAAPAAGTYSLGQTVLADFSCTDAASLVVGCDGTVAHGAAIDTSSAGSKVFTVNATDAVGNPTSAAIVYTVDKGVPIITWPAPADIVYGTRLDGTQLNATANVAGSFSYDPSGAVPSYADQVLMDSPLVYYRFDELSGSVAADGSSHGRHGTYSGVALDAATAAAGLGRAIAFDGADDSVLVPALGTHGQLTIEVWVQPSSVSVEAFYHPDGFSPGTLHLLHGGGNALVQGINEAGFSPENDRVFANALTIGAWQHLVTTYDRASGQVRLHVNGVLAATQTYAGAPPFAHAMLNTGRLGAWFDGTSLQRFFTGRMDEFAVYSAVLSPARIAAHYAARHEAGTPGTLLDAGTHTLMTTFVPDDAANYVAASAQVSLEVRPATPAIVVTGGTFVHDANPRAAAVTVTGLEGASLVPDWGAVVVSYSHNGSPLGGPPTDVGTYLAAASFTSADGNYTDAEASATLEITAGTAIVSLSNLAHTYDGSPKTAVVATTPAGVSVVVTYDEAAAAPTNHKEGGYAVVATVDDPNYQGSANDVLTIAKAQSSTSVTVPGGESFTYDGAAHPAVVSVTGAGGLTETPAASYDCGHAPQDVADSGCVASYSYAGGPNHEPSSGSVTYTIAKATATVTLGSLTHIYDGTPKSATATTDPAGLAGVSITYDGAAAAPTDHQAGGYAVVATLDDPNYQGSASEVLTIAKAPSSTSVTVPGGENFTYDTLPHPAVVSVTGAGGLTEMPVPSYDCGHAPQDVADSGCVASYSYPGGPNHEPSSGSVTYSIAKATAALTLGNLSHTYDGTPKAATAATDPAGFAGVSITYDSAATAPTDHKAGGYAVVATLDDPNYQGSASDVLTIAKAQSQTSVTVPGGENFTYDTFPHPAAVSVTGAGGLTETPAPSYSCGHAPQDVADSGCIASYSYAGGPNHEPSSGSVTYTIAKAPATVTLGNLSHTYDGTRKTATATTDPADLAGVSITYDGAATPPTDHKAGGYGVGATLGNPNYEAAEASGTLTIARAPLVVTPANHQKVYGDAFSAFTGTLATVLGADSITASYSSPGAPGSALVGPHTITATLQDPGSRLHNYDVTLNTGTLTVAAAPLTVVTDNKTRVYGDANPAFTGAISGLKNADVVTASHTTPATPASPHGQYAINASLNDPGSRLSNYTISNPGGTLTITRAPLMLHADNASRPFGIANPVFTGGYAGQKNGESFTVAFTTSATPASPVGSYPIVPAASGPTLDNYTVVAQNGVLSVAAWDPLGFQSPVGVVNSVESAPNALAPTQSSLWNTIKGGQTVPLKFNLYQESGGLELTSLGSVAGFTLLQVACTAGLEDPVEADFATSGGSSLRYEDGHFIQNWQSPKGAGRCYRATMQAADGSKVSAFFKTK